MGFQGFSRTKIVKRTSTEERTAILVSSIDMRLLKERKTN